MAPGERVGGVLSRLAELQETVEQLEKRAEALSREIALLKEQITGERGLNAAIKELANQVGGVRRAAWWLGGIVVTASIGFAFGVLALIPA